MKCKKCNKQIKENTDGNLKYCQGHYLINEYIIKRKPKCNLNQF
jgi:hypothetical protein